MGIAHLAPPALAKRNERGELVKQPYGPWMRSAFGVLARLKGLRGTALDPFGRSEERRTERALIDEYKASIDELLPRLAPENIDLAAEIGSLFEFSEALVEEKGGTLSRSGEGSVFGDRLMLRRAVNTLLSNAVRQTPKGGVIKAVIDESDAAIITLSIENTGETIAPEHLVRLFDRFYRANASPQSFGEGAGLGLAITRSIAHAPVSYTHLRAHETVLDLVCRLLLANKKEYTSTNQQRSTITQVHNAENIQ